ncbi:transposase (fragment) [Xenorhabdus bovienii SS-2004]|uniref:Transposase n=1 Tax=Xenorhabdus bovienii (strain SS-2004) TaxID=406818 RepID=D3V5T1_XENBS
MKRIVAHVFGDRSRKTLDKLLTLLSSFTIRFYCTDDYVVYDPLPEEEHLTGKAFTQRIYPSSLKMLDFSFVSDHDCAHEN